MLLRGFLFAVLAVGLQAQAPDDNYQALQDALGLSDSQLGELQQNAPTEIGAPLHDGLLDGSQRAKLAEIRKVTDRWYMACVAIDAGLIEADEWPWRMCPCSVFSSALPSFDFTPTQAQRLYEQHLRNGFGYSEVVAKEHQRSELIKSGSSEDSPAVVQLTSDISKFRKLIADAGPRRNQALAVLDDAQKAKFAIFYAALHLLNEAIDLGLIPHMGGGEILCQ